MHRDREIEGIEIGLERCIDREIDMDKEREREEIEGGLGMCVCIRKEGVGVWLAFPPNFLQVPLCLPIQISHFPPSAQPLPLYSQSLPSHLPPSAISCLSL